MRRSALLVRLTAAALGLTGCQTGRVYDLSVSDDGQCIAYADGGAFVADERGVRRVGSGRPVLSADGDQLLLVSDGKRAFAWLRLSTGERHEARVPPDLAWREIDQVWFTQSGPAFRLESVPDEQWLEWDPLRGWGPLRGSQSVMHASARSVTPVQQDNEFVFEIRPDAGGRYTVWIRPDGTVVELTRQNDGVARVLRGALGLVLLPPSILLGGYAPLIPLVWIFDEPPYHRASVNPPSIIADKVRQRRESSPPASAPAPASR